MAYTVSEAARVAGVTVRTLHHYDAIGLLPPGARSDAGYRLYDRADLERLQEILLYRELGFGLGEITAAMDDPCYDRLAALRTQREQVVGKAAHLQRVIAAIDAAIDAHERGIPMDEADMFEVFGDFDPRAHEAEVEERWAGELLDESRRRTSSYTAEQWREAMAEGEAVTNAFAAALRSGEPADATAAMDIAERHRLQIDRWFYPCAYEVHVGLGDMYVADPRFTATYDAAERGLAAYIRDAIAANAARAAD
jgi:DNA-binding transcriptional MerR regulator